MWTQFWDMHSGGGSKEKWTQIFIEASQNEAEVIFYNKFDHNPNRVSCTCCGSDYSISEYESLEQATAYHRGCDYVNDKYIEEPDLNGFREYKTLEEFERESFVLIIRKEEINSEERIGSVPDQGYMWVD